MSGTLRSVAHHGGSIDAVVVTTDKAVALFDKSDLTLLAMKELTNTSLAISHSSLQITANEIVWFISYPSEFGSGLGIYFLSNDLSTVASETHLELDNLALDVMIFADRFWFT